MWLLRLANLDRHFARLFKLVCSNRGIVHASNSLIREFLFASKISVYIWELSVRWKILCSLSLHSWNAQFERFGTVGASWTSKVHVRGESQETTDIVHFRYATLLYVPRYRRCFFLFFLSLFLSLSHTHTVSAISLSLDSLAKSLWHSFSLAIAAMSID